MHHPGALLPQSAEPLNRGPTADDDTAGGEKRRISFKAKIIWRKALTDALSLTRERVRVWVSENNA